MAYGSQLFALGNSARQRGFAGAESGLERLMRASQQASDQAFAAREAAKQRRFQDEQRKKQEKAQKKAMWTSLGINAGAGAASAGISAAALAPAATGAQIAGTAAATGATTAGTTAAVNAARPAVPDVSMSMGMPTVAPTPTPQVDNLVAQPPVVAQYQLPLMTMPRGKAVGTAVGLGLLDGIAGTRNANTFLGQLASAPNQAVQWANLANDNAVQWTRLGLDQKRQNDNVKRYQDQEAGRNKRNQDDAALSRELEAGRMERHNNPVPRPRLPMFNSRPGGVSISTTDPDEALAFHEQHPMNFAPQHPASQRVGFSVNPETGAVQSMSVPDPSQIATIKENLGKQGLNFPVPLGAKPTKAPTISMGKNGATVSGTDLASVQNTYDQINPPANFQGIVTRIANDLNGGGNPEGTIAQALKEGAITEAQANDLRDRVKRARGR